VQSVALIKAVAKLREIARTAAARGETSQRTADIRECAKCRAQPSTQVRIVMKETDQIETSVDLIAIGQGRSEIGGQQPRTGARNRTIDCVE